MFLPYQTLSYAFVLDDVAFYIHWVDNPTPEVRRIDDALAVNPNWMITDDLSLWIVEAAQNWLAEVMEMPLYEYLNSLPEP